MDQIIAEFAPYVAATLSALLGLIFIRIEKYIREKVKSEKAELAFIGVNDIARTVVTEFSQTLVADLKAKSEDGKLTKEEALDAKNKAVRKVKTLLPGETSKVLRTLVSDLDEYIASKIEEEVAVNK